MPQETDWNFTFVFCVGILGFLVSGILYFTNKNGSFSARILSAYLFCIAFVCMHFNLSNTSFFLSFPHLWRTAVFASFCVPALSFLYTRTILEQQYRFTRTDILYFLPAILYTLSMVPYYLLPATEKLRFIEGFMRDKTLIASEPEGLLPVGWGFLLRMLYGFPLAIAQYSIVIKSRRKILSGKAPSRQNKNTLNWLAFYTITISLTYGILLVEAVLHISRFFDLNRLIIFTISCNILFVTAYLLVQPNILYGLSGWQQQEAEPAEAKKNPNRSTISTEQENSYRALLENHLAKNKSFLKAGYKILDLSEELNIPTYLLSAFINQEYGKNFNELINDQRVNHLIHLLKTAPDYSNYTLEALGKMVGFNSRSTFIEAVKKHTGQTPTEFFGNLRSSNPC